MAASNAMRYEQAIKAFTDPLTAAGKPFKVVAAAAMRKLLTMLNAIVKSGTPWKEDACPANASII